MGTLVGRGGRSGWALAALWTLAGVWLAVAGACGGSSGGGDPSAAIAACNAWCDALAARSCADPLYDTAADCKESECAGLGAEPARCFATTKAYYDCRAAQADICADTGCAAEGAADLTCLLGGSVTGVAGTGGGSAGTGGGSAGTGGGGGGSSGFTPAAFGGRLVVWLDAARGISGTPVASWTDQSGAGNNATQAMAPSQPALTASGINGLPAVTFDGVLTFLQIADSPTTRFGTGDFALMVVARGAPNVATNAMLYNKSEAAAPYAGINLFLNVTRGAATAKASLQLDADFHATTRDDFGDANPHLFGGRLVTSGASALLEVRVDGERQGMLSLTGGAVNLDAPVRATIIGHNGYNALSGFQAFKGDIAEVVAVKGTISDAELASLEAYLMGKYGL
jgi:hypothetical protein